jgi:hypothetical protein
MNKTQTKKLASLVNKASNQSEAVLSYLSVEGNTVSPAGARNAGIADPRRVVNRLRNEGYNIVRDVVTGRTTSTITYTLAPTKKSKKKASK